MKTVRIIIVSAVMLLLASLLGFIVGWTVRDRELQNDTHTDVEVVERDSTICNPVKEDSTVVGTILVPVVGAGHTPSTPGIIPTGNTQYIHDTVTEHDTVYAAIPMSAFHFTDPLADVWCTGFNIRMDSIRVKQRDIYITQTTTVRAREYHNTLGVMMGFDDVSLLYTRRFGRVSVGFSGGYTYRREPVVRGFVGWNF